MLLGYNGALRRRAVPAVILTALLATGCQAWHVVPLSPVPSHAPRTIRVVRLSGESVDLRDARITSDSVYGRGIVGGAPVSVPRNDVARVEAPKFSLGRTLGLLGGIYLALGVFALLLALSLAPTM